MKRLNRLTIKRPCDFHTHVRSPAQVGDRSFRWLVRMNCMHYHRVVVEPNTFLDPHDKKHHIETASDVSRYSELVLAALPPEHRSIPLFLIKLTPRTTPATILEAVRAGAIGVKLYPEGVTTGSEHGGVSDFCSSQILACLECLEENQLIFQVHPEMPGEFCMDREQLFHTTIVRWAKQFPKLRMFVEHITDGRTIRLIQNLREDDGATVYGTITGHHLHITLDDVLGQADHHCWPCAKRREDRDELQTSIAHRPFSWLLSITDSAPWKYKFKHLTECACAGVFNPAHIAIPHIVQLFEEQNGFAGGLQLEAFTAKNGIEAYRLPQHDHGSITLVRKPWTVPQRFDTGSGLITPFRAGDKLNWQIENT